jgi:small GTP-binding protein
MNSSCWIEYKLKIEVFRKARSESLHDSKLSDSSASYCTIGNFNNNNGKTCLLKRLIDGTFTGDNASTIGVEFDSLILNIDNRKVKLQIWDTAGQERFRSISKTYYRNAVGVVLVFDLTGRKSFDSLTSWLTDIHALCDSNAVTQLIGNKSDLSARRVVTMVEAEAFAKQHQMGYMETSAKIGENVREAFVHVAATIMNKGLKTIHQPGPKPKPLLPIQEAPKSDQGGAC